MKPATIDPRLADWATERQAEYIAAINKHGGIRPAAKVLKVDSTSLTHSMSRLKAHASTRGYSPDHDMTRPVPDTHLAKGVSTYYDADGKVRGQWVKSTLRGDAVEQAMKDFASELAAGVKGLAPLTQAPSFVDDELLCVYPMGDPHFGLYAWWQDAGDNFDLPTAERLTTGAVDRLVASAPAAGTALLLNLGDMYHADNQGNTTKSGHQLDVDGRWKKVQRVGLKAMIHCILRLLEKHRKVIFRINGGNHDDHSSYGLAVMLSCFFENEPRVEIDLSPAPMWYMQFGQVLIGSTHGDLCKGSNLVPVMAADMPVAWGQTRHRHWYVGHVHHQDVKEYPGGVVEYFRTLAARDAWHQGQGYRAGRDMRLIVMHREHGEIERHRCDVAMIKQAA